jgi:AraC family transcriptional regulator
LRDIGRTENNDCGRQSGKILPQRKEPLLGQSYGEVLNTFENSALILSESTYLPETVINKHSHAHAYFCILLHGTYTENYGRRCRECKRSTVVFHPPNEAHSTHFLNEGGHLFRFEIKPALFDRMSECSAAFSEPVEFDGGLPAQIAARLYREFRQTDEISSLVIEGLALEVSSYVARARKNERFKKPPIWLTRARDLIRDEFCTKLSLNQIADAAGVHPLHLVRVFHKFEGCTIGEYIKRLRVEFAAQQLSNSEISLAELAIASGFCDQAHFSKTFRLSTGMTPSQYRSVFRSG